MVCDLKNNKELLLSRGNQFTKFGNSEEKGSKDIIEWTAFGVLTNWPTGAKQYDPAFSKWGIKRAYVLKANYNWDKFVYYSQKFECNLNSHLCCKSYSSETCIQINYWVQHVLSKSMHWHGSLLCTGKFKISMSEDNSLSK